MKTSNITKGILSAALLALTASSASAAVIINVTEVGDDVVATATGSIDTGDLGLWGNGSAGGAAMPSSGGLLLGSGNFDYYIFTDGSINGPAAMGNGGTAEADSNTGGLIGLIPGEDSIFVPTGYNSGDAINSSSTWNNTTLAEMGFTTDTYVYSWGSANADTITVTVGAVPEPATLGLMVVAGGVVYLRRRSKLRDFS